MSQQRQVAVIVGSLRTQSFTRKAAEALIGLAPPSLAFQHIAFDALPLYNQDFDDEKRPPEQWVAFRDQIRPLDAVLFMTPEYNRSVPGVLKNAIDVGSRPYGASVWSKKPAAVMSVSPGALGAFGANHHLRQSLVFLDMPTLQMPEAYVGGAARLFDEHGALKDEGTAKLFKSFIDAFAALIETVKA